MFVSAYSPDLTATVDVVVVGSSLAALPIALALSDRNRRVLIVEGGGARETGQAAALTESYESGMFSDGYWARHWIRALGGTSRRWSGWIAPLDARDLHQNAAGVDWPITIEALKPAYYEAARWLGRTAFVIDYRQPYLDTPFVFKPFSRGPALRVAETFADRLAADPNIRVLTQHVVTRLESNPSRSAVAAIHMTDFAATRRRLTVPPGVNVVLACGGLGNAQILLQPGGESDTPVGNESGLVGQFLMEHPHARCADVLIAEETLPRPASEFGEFTSTLIVGDAEYRRHQLLACTLSIEPAGEQDETDGVQAGFEALLGRPLQRRTLYARAEQGPDGLNCVKLLAETDWAGSYKLEIHNCLRSRDLRSIETTVRLLAHALAERRIGGIKIDNVGLYRQATGGGHTMGTTRMGTNPRDSVCDSHQKVHGYDNLYLAGSSVFPTSGASNPTLTIVALSLRLADHLLQRTN
jgi:choline dehydrogenase-like flavoprotein